MSWKTVAVFLLLGLLVSAVPASAQESGRIFKLLRDTDSAARELDLEAEDQVAWERQLAGRKLEFGFALGFLNLGTTLLQHDQIIYKYTTEFTYWGDVELNGDTAFAPVLRLGYSVNDWLALEGNASLSFSEYKATITNRRARKNEPGAAVLEDVALGEYDAENRSLITFLGGGNALIYPMGLIRDGKGMFQPFLTAGFGRMWYDMNSQYSDGPVSTNNFNFGGGLRVLGDERLSIRFDLLYHMNTLQLDAPTYFQILDQGTTLILLEEHPIINNARVDRVVEEYDSQDIKSLNWSIGIQGTF